MPKYPPQQGQGSFDFDPPGYNLGPTQASQSASDPDHLGYRQRIANAAVSYLNSRTPRMGSSLPPLQRAAAEIHPGGPAAVEGTQWAFRGNRTAHTHSLAREQNVYGGVQRTSIPTERIQMKRKLWEEGNWGRDDDTEERHMLNYEALYPPGLGGGPLPSVQSGVGHPMLPQMAGQALASSAAMQGGSEDPLFASNTQQGLNVNPLQFNAHQRAVTGLRS